MSKVYESMRITLRMPHPLQTGFLTSTQLKSLQAMQSYLSNVCVISLVIALLFTYLLFYHLLYNFILTFNYFYFGNQKCKNPHSHFQFFKPNADNRKIKELIFEYH